MNTRNLAVALFAVSGLAGTDVASAQSSVGTAQVAKMFGSSMHDLAPVTNSSPAMLRRNRNDQPGAEHATVAMFTDADGRQTHGIYFARVSTWINGAGPTDNVQGAMVGFTLTQDTTTGLVSAVLDPTIPAQFITTNNGSEQRNFQVPTAYSFNNGTAIAIEYTYRPNDRSYRYMMAYNATGAKIMGQTKIYAKTNDDCAMMQDGAGGGVTAFDATKPTAPVSHVLKWMGCNGDGDDDGWADSFDLTTDSATAPTVATWKQNFDVALCQQEERSRGNCTVGTDPNTAICSWTEGDDQPQKDGTWIAAIDITPGKYTGTDKQESIYWKQMVDGRKEATSDGTPTTYSQRAMHERIQMPDANGVLQNTDTIIWRSGDARGNNNDDQKGGTYYRNNMAIMNVTKAGMTYVLPLQDMQKTLSGLDGTHLGVGPAVFGTMDAPMAGLMFMGGSQFGGGYGAQLTAVAFDKSTASMKKLGDFSGAPLDRHMYSNYLGQNPGNQGRNFSHTIMIANPFVGMNGSKDAYLELIASNGKDSTEVAKTNPDNTVMDTCYAADDTSKTTPVACARLKLSSYLTVLPIAQVAAGCGAGNGTGGGNGMGCGSGTGSGTGTGSATGSGSDVNDPTDPGVTIGGCSATGGAGGAGMFLLIGLAAFIRRRR